MASGGQREIAYFTRWENCFLNAALKKIPRVLVMEDDEYTIWATRRLEEHMGLVNEMLGKFGLSVPGPAASKANDPKASAAKRNGSKANSRTTSVPERTSGKLLDGLEELIHRDIVPK